MKKFYPNMWDITVGGHISAGEDALVSVKREFREELGLNLEDFHCKYLDKVKEEFLNNGIDSREFVYVYLVVGDVEIDSLKLQVEEVSEARWFSKSEFLELVDSSLIISHEEEFKMLKKVLK